MSLQVSQALKRERDIEAARHAVLRIIEREDDPDRRDLAFALEAIPDKPVPQELIDYVRKKYIAETKLIRPGRQRRAFQSAREVTVPIFHRLVYTYLRGKEDIKEVKTLAIAETAAEFGMSARQVRRVLDKARQDGRRIV